MDWNWNPVSALSKGYDAVTNGAQSAWNGALDVAKKVDLSTVGHTALDVAGMVPVVGEAADLANAGWYLAEGDKTNAALSAAAAIPGLGNAATAAKLGKKAITAGKGLAKAEKAGDVAGSVATAARTADRPAALVSPARTTTAPPGGSTAARQTTTGRTGGATTSGTKTDAPPATRIPGQRKPSEPTTGTKSAPPEPQTSSAGSGARGTGGPGSNNRTAVGAADGPEPTGPGSAAHKAQRWAEYQARGGDWSYDRWSTAYDNNMVRARAANEAVDNYHSTLGWGRREVTVDVDVDGKTVARRLDIADVATQRGVEYKTGYQTANEANRWEVARDKELVEQGWNIEWVFRDTASKPLLDQLKEAGIPYRFVGP